jgi:hypothetical protein
MTRKLWSVNIWSPYHSYSLFNFLWLILKIIFFISSFNNELVENWASLCSQGLEFHRLRVWNISSCLGGAPPLPFFFRLMFFQFHHSSFIQLKIGLCFFFFFTFYKIFFLIIKMTQVISNLFYFSFFDKFRF